MKLNAVSTTVFIFTSIIDKTNGVQSTKNESATKTCTESQEEVTCEEEENSMIWWKDLNDKCKNQYKSQGWTEEMWNHDIHDAQDEWDWDEIPQDRKEFLMSIGWTEEKWDSGDNPGVFEPKITNIDIPELNKFNFDYFEKLDLPIQVMDGTKVGDDEGHESHYMVLSEYMKLFRQGTNLYLKYEDGEPFQKKLHKIIGKEVFHAFEGKLREIGLIEDEWNNYEYNEENWSFWLGSAGTSTSLHIDYDLFNFLWVREGKKRVVMIPNTEETRAKYRCKTLMENHSCWPDVDVLHNGTLPENAVELIIGPGQGIVIPRLSWHAVENLEPTIAFGFRIDDYIL